MHYSNKWLNDTIHLMPYIAILLLTFALICPFLTSGASHQGTITKIGKSYIWIDNTAFYNGIQPLLWKWKRIEPPPVGTQVTAQIYGSWKLPQIIAITPTTHHRPTRHQPPAPQTPSAYLILPDGDSTPPENHAPR